MTESAEAFAARLLGGSAERYHDRHPFHVAMHDGALTREQVRAWVANRYYYQTRIPRKDALIVAKSEDPAFRRAWLRRVHDHDDEGGGLALWEQLGEAVGIARDALRAHEEVLPRARAACDRYVALVRDAPLVVAVAASLTERLAPDLMERRIEAFERHYPWVGDAGLAYFRARVARAREDGDAALAFVLAHATTPDLRDRCVDALLEKTAILSELLDALVEAHGIGADAERPRLAAHARLAEDRARGGVVILGLDRAIRLDERAERVVRLCDGSRTVLAIAERLAEAHGAAPEAVAADVRALVESLVAKRILEVRPR